MRSRAFLKKYDMIGYSKKGGEREDIGKVDRQPLDDKI